MGGSGCGAQLQTLRPTLSVCGQNQPGSCGSESATSEVKHWPGCSCFWNTWGDVSTQSEPTTKHYCPAPAGMVGAADRTGAGPGPGNGGKISAGRVKTSHQPANRLWRSRPGKTSQEPANRLGQHSGSCQLV